MKKEALYRDYPLSQSGWQMARPPEGHLLVSVCMIAFNVEKYLAAAIEGVLDQRVDFPFELVLGEDCSNDETRKICEAYVEKHAGIIKLLPSDQNRGIAGNAFRTWQHCQGKYIAICDGDDIWTDPYKLSKQVDFLENNPDYGAVYSDVETISETGAPIEDEIHDRIRASYAEGKVFFKLLAGNFINNSTAVFRRVLIEGYEVNQDRNYYTHDYLLWLHIAAQSKICFMRRKTTQYRKHSEGVTHSGTREQNNRLMFQQRLPSILSTFARQYPWPLSDEEKALLFQKLLSVLYRGKVSAKTKWEMLRLAFRHFPGARSLAMLFIARGRERLGSSIQTYLKF